tara:strand:+ start:474 stop:719 length:246 start_codon:yes stop_codon:yes gene_type:complete
MFEKFDHRWLNTVMKSSISSVKNSIVSRYLEEDEEPSQNKTSNINILLNRVKLDQKRESRKKLIFSAVTSAGILLFGFMIF